MSKFVIVEKVIFTHKTLQIGFQFFHCSAVTPQIAYSTSLRLIFSSVKWNVSSESNSSGKNPRLKIGDFLVKIWSVLHQTNLKTSEKSHCNPSVKGVAGHYIC